MMRVKKMRRIVLIIIAIAATACAKSHGLSPREGFVDVPGGKVWYRIAGSGTATPLLLLHGGPGFPSDYLAPLGKLADERPAIFCTKWRATMTNDNLVFMSARELGTMIRKKTVSPTEVVRAFLERAKALNSKLNAFITITEEQAMTRAWEAERDIMAGDYKGPLHGIPYAPKDIFATKGIRTTNGSKATANWIPPHESTATERLNKAGAIMIGKLNLGEFATGSGVLSGFGPVHNPWQLGYSASGSSSGSGSALAASLTPLSLGTDTGGSIRGPAAFCGIVGMKPTYGRVSRYGVTTLSWTLDHAGPMARTVGDVAMLLGVIAGPDPKDPSSVPDPVPDYSKSLTGKIKGLRIGIPKTYFFEKLDPQVDRAVRAAIQKLVDMGAVTVDVDVSFMEMARSGGLYWAIVRPEEASFHEQRVRQHPELLDPLVREKLEGSYFISATDYIKAQRVRTLLMQGMAKALQNCDVLVSPGNRGLAGKHESPETAGMEFKPGTTPSPPSSATGSLTNVGNMTGVPAIVVPCGFSTTNPVLPITIMFYAKPLDEPTLLRVAHAYESATDWHARRPLL